jgi:hypothetical protein
LNSEKSSLLPKKYGVVEIGSSSEMGSGTKVLLYWLAVLLMAKINFRSLLDAIVFTLQGQRHPTDVSILGLNNTLLDHHCFEDELER